MKHTVRLRQGVPTSSAASAYATSDGTPRRGARRLSGAVLLLAAALPGLRSSPDAGLPLTSPLPRSSGQHGAATIRRYLPAVVRAPTPRPPAPTPSPGPGGCPTLATQAYGELALDGPPLHARGEGHPDLDIAVRGWEQVVPQVVPGGAGLVNYDGPTDGRAPQLAGLAPSHVRPGHVSFSGLFRVHDWDWASNRRSGLITAWPVTFAAVALPAGRELHVPDSGYDIGRGFEVLVIHAAAGRVTLTYTRSDNVARGYTLHVTGVCVEPRLLALYERLDAAGRDSLPALRTGDAFGTVATGAVGVAIRDTGSFMDPRSRKDWWRGF